MEEFLSELWDGFLESYHMRSFSEEGNLKVYVPFIGASSYKFLHYLTDEMFEQGLANRFLWIDEPVKFKKLERKFFFGGADMEFRNFKKNLFEDLQWLSKQRTTYGDEEEGNLNVYMTDDAKDLWLAWGNPKFEAI